MRPLAMVRLAFLVCLGLAAVSVAGCQDENDPRTWVRKLSSDTKRPLAMRRLREMFQSRMSNAHPPDNIRDPGVQEFLNTSLPDVVTAFSQHPEEISTRKDGITILARSQDPRAIPGLLSALEFHLGNAESERIALDAANALKDLHPRGNAQVVQKLLSTIDRAAGNSRNAAPIRESCIRALGAIGDHSVVDRLISVLTRPLDQQEIRTARACADALGEMNEPRSAEALVYGLYLNLQRNNAFPHCTRALMHLGPDAAVPVLIRTMQSQNPQVTLLLNAYNTMPGISPPPPGYEQATAIDVLRNFADPRAIDPLLAVLGNRELIHDPPAAGTTTPGAVNAGATANVRGAAAETLAYTALSLPMTDPRRAAIVTAIDAVFREAPAGSPEDMSSIVAPAMSLIGDPRAPTMIGARLADRALAAEDMTAARVGLLMPFASSARHADVALYDRMALPIQTTLDNLLRANPDAIDEVRPVRQSLDTTRAVIAVVRTCNDGDIACYQGILANPAPIIDPICAAQTPPCNPIQRGNLEKAAVRKAAYMIAWTGGDNPAAREALLARADNPDPLVRRSINVAIDALSPHGCEACITRLEAILHNEENQESKSLMHLEAQMLISRLRNRH